MWHVELVDLSFSKLLKIWGYREYIYHHFLTLIDSIITHN